MANKWNLEGVRVTDENILVAEGGLTVEGAVVIMSNLQTTDPEIAGRVWNDSGVLTVSSGPEA